MRNVVSIAPISEWKSKERSKSPFFFRFFYANLTKYEPSRGKNEGEDAYLSVSSMKKSEPLSCSAHSWSGSSFIGSVHEIREGKGKREGGGLGRRGRESEDPSGPDTTKCTEIYSAGN